MSLEMREREAVVLITTAIEKHYPDLRKKYNSDNPSIKESLSLLDEGIKFAYQNSSYLFATPHDNAYKELNALKTEIAKRTLVPQLSIAKDLFAQLFEQLAQKRGSYDMQSVEKIEKTKEKIDTDHPFTPALIQSFSTRPNYPMKALQTIEAKQDIGFLQPDMKAKGYPKHFYWKGEEKQNNLPPLISPEAKAKMKPKMSA